MHLVSSCLHKIFWASLIKGCSWFPWFKLYYNWPDFLLWVSVKDGLTSIMHHIYLIHIKFDTHFITTPFNIIYNTNIIIFIILNTMDTLHQQWPYWSLSSHFISSFWSALYCIAILDRSCIIFAFCSSNFSSDLFTIFSWNAPKSFCRHSFVTSGFIKLSK